MERLGGVFGCLLQIVGLVLGLFQLAAMMAQLESLWGLNSWISAAIGVAFLVFFPIVIPFFSFFGAKDVWGWDWWQALLFAAPFLVFAVISVLSGGILSVLGRLTSGREQR
jgi:hypothetical protein